MISYTSVEERLQAMTIEEMEKAKQIFGVQYRHELKEKLQELDWMLSYDNPENRGLRVPFLGFPPETYER